ncbi:hypothetical protein CRI93_10815 [Longimonas halophila]|uniref:RagB/SusD domain-containing protein n=1 Tax=Longimonas halophila TaxID=1469170 RepID=A0A2H3NVN2_9BACT|nr:hypothetical protein [Longimonas halophila]PEN05967.1 hypothetical protein CRI93_10815 [Longimonas halophila]
MTFAACDSFVANVDQPVDEAGSDQFSDPAEAEFLITGVQAQWADSHSGVTDLADGLSDEFRFGINGDATFPTFAQLDAGIIADDNNSITGALNDLQEYRFLADDLLRRVEEDERFDLSDPSATASEEQVRLVANVHGANARYYLATYFGHPDDPRRGGATIDTSAFIPSPELYQQADDKYAAALAEAEALESGLQQRQIQSARARAALYAGTHDFQDSGGFQGQEALEAAAEYARQGLQQGESWDVAYDLNTGNDYHFQAGAGRLQLAVQDGNFNQLATRSPDPSQSYRVADEDTGELVARSHIETVANNPDELNRIPLTIINNGGTTLGGFGALPENLQSEALGDDLFPTIFDAWQPNGDADPIGDLIGDEGEDIIEWGQGKWEQRTNMPFVSWQELFLIRAELELRGFDAGGESALALVNTVRDSYGLSSLSDIDLERLAVERDRTLFATGHRLPDQRRMDVVEWHLKDQVGGQQTAQWLQLTRAETEPNPNF